jgi:hypothetical protein
MQPQPLKKVIEEFELVPPLTKPGRLQISYQISSSMDKRWTTFLEGDSPCKSAIFDGLKERFIA